VSTPRSDITLRLQSDLEALTSILRVRCSQGPRRTSPLQFTDIQRRRFGPITFFRIRKTFD